MDIGRPGQQQTYFRKVIRKDNDQISLDADMIRLLIAIDENKSLYQIADEVDMRADTLKLNLEKLLQQGLINQFVKSNWSHVRNFNRGGRVGNGNNQPRNSGGSGSGIDCCAFS
jgi:hypothetical protein